LQLDATSKMSKTLSVKGSGTSAEDSRTTVVVVVVAVVVVLANAVGAVGDY
jgi:hypothetical protein